jgi:septum site-determining protein MinC
MTLVEKKFPIKGFKEGLLIKVGEGNWKDVQANLMKQIDERIDFFKGAKVALDLEERIMRAAEMGALRDKLSDRGVILFAVISKSSLTDSVAESLGLSTHQTVLKERDSTVRNAIAEGEAAVLIRKTLRSGVSIKHPGHVIIEGDVNSGAEVLAGGSIYIWGKLRGMAHAGIEGSEQAVICAMEINSQQLRIANYSREVSKLKLSLNKNKLYPQKACLSDGEIKITNWNSDNPLK